MSIDLCGINCNTEQTGDDEDADAMHSKVTGVGVPERMCGDVFLDPRPFRGSNDVFSQTVTAKAGLLKALKYIFAVLVKLFEDHNCLFGKGDCSFTPRFCASSLTVSDMEQSLFKVDVLPVEMCQLVTPEAGICKYRNHSSGRFMHAFYKSMKFRSRKKNHLMFFDRNKSHLSDRVFGEITPFNSEVEYTFEMHNSMIHRNGHGPAIEPPDFIILDQPRTDLFKFNICDSQRFKEAEKYSTVLPVTLDRERPEMNLYISVIFIKEIAESSLITASVFPPGKPDFNVLFDRQCQLLVVGFQGFLNSFTAERIKKLNPVNPFPSVNTRHNYYNFTTMTPSQKIQSGEYRDITRSLMPTDLLRREYLSSSLLSRNIFAIRCHKKTQKDIIYYVFTTYKEIEDVGGER